MTPCEMLAARDWDFIEAKAKGTATKSVDKPALECLARPAGSATGVHVRVPPMHPPLGSRLATPVALTSLAIWFGFGLLVFAIGASPKVITTVAPATDEGAEAITLAVADVDELQAPATTAKSDRLPLRSPSAPPSSLTAEPAVLKPAEALDYAQAEAEHVRHAYAEAPDLCQRHGMHKRYFNVGRRQSWRCER